MLATSLLRRLTWRSGQAPEFEPLQVAETELAAQCVQTVNSGGLLDSHANWLEGMGKRDPNTVRWWGEFEFAKESGLLEMLRETRECAAEWNAGQPA